MKRKGKNKKTKYSSPTLSRREVSSDTMQKDNGATKGSKDDYGFLNNPISIITKKNGVLGKKHNKKIKGGTGNHDKQQPVTSQQSAVVHNHQTSRQDSRLQQYLSRDTQNSDPNYMFHMQSRSTTQEALAMTFYDEHTQERRPRSVSRSRHSSSGRGAEARPDRSRSKSRDIFALYTSNHQSLSRPTTPGYSPEAHVHPQCRSRSHTPSRGLRSYKYQPGMEDRQSMSLLPQSNYSVVNYPYQRAQNSVYGRSRSVASPQNRSKSTEPFARAQSESRCSSRARDAISLCSNWSTRSRALSSSEIASQNLDRWILNTSRNRRKRSQQRKKEEEEEQQPPANFVTLLEMDAERNHEIESMLNNANSVRPAGIKMMMIAGHAPSKDWASADEIEVKPGSIITGLYKQSEWLHVQTEEGEQGFVPYAFTKAIRQEAIQTTERISRSSCSSSSHQPDVKPKHLLGNLSHISSSTSYQNIGTNRDSLNSDNVFLTDPVYSTVRPSRNSGGNSIVHGARRYADCIVVDTDHKYSGAPGEELPTYCSDSGISEPNSNHSDHDAGLVQNNRKYSSGHQVIESTSSVDSTQPGMRTLPAQHPINGVHDRSYLNHMPLGPLGQRLLRSADHTNKNNVYKSLLGPIRLGVSDDMKARATETSNDIPDQLKPDIPKDYNGPRVRVVYPYQVEQSDDACVEKGEVVTILNGEDIEWIWVQKRDGSEGFIPREYVVPVVVSQAKAKPSQKHLIVAL